MTSVLDGIGRAAGHPWREAERVSTPCRWSEARDGSASMLVFHAYPTIDNITA
jgi:hypothetical protein